MATLEDVDKLLSGATVAGPADTETIRSAEAKLGVSFPPSYRAFLARYGAAIGKGTEIAGLFRNDKPDEPPLWSDVVSSTLGTRRASRGYIPKEYVPISSDGGDYTFYLDTGCLDTEGECPVRVLGPGADGLVVAKDFFEFVVRAFGGTIEW
jgi:hypothetical protein